MEVVILDNFIDHEVYNKVYLSKVRYSYDAIHQYCSNDKEFLLKFDQLDSSKYKYFISKLDYNTLSLHKESSYNKDGGYLYFRRNAFYILPDDFKETQLTIEVKEKEEFF